MSYIPPPSGQPPIRPIEAPASPNVRAVALRQRAIIFCILFTLLLIVIQIGTVFLMPGGLTDQPNTPPPNFGVAILLPVEVLAGWAIRIVSSVFVFLLAIALYGAGIGVTLGILTLIPYLGIIPLLIVNGKATGVLRASGIHVGLMGANRDQIPPS